MSSDWRADAYCRDADTETFYPHPSANPQHALWYCRRCPVTVQCLNDAMEAESTGARAQYRYGVWGGLTGEQRAQLAARNSRAGAAGSRVRVTCSACGHRHTNECGQPGCGCRQPVAASRGDQLVEDVETLTSAGETLEGIAARVGLEVDSLRKALRRYQREDLIPA